MGLRGPAICWLQAEEEGKPGVVQFEAEGLRIKRAGGVNSDLSPKVQQPRELMSEGGREVSQLKQRKTEFAFPSPFGVEVLNGLDDARAR